MPHGPRRVIKYQGQSQPAREKKLVENRTNKVQCPRCGLWVKIKKNGEIYEHRAPGRRFIDRVPCFTP